ncbi:MAG TPA: hypothetical protein DCY69_04490, partial [Acidimicrobiaceae bacterium]|nr:hypothetical protein [Acidimicrobiaceae bacterium]
MGPLSGLGPSLSTIILNWRNAMSDNYTLISSDCHAGGNMKAYEEYLEARWKDAFKEWRGAYSNPFRDLQDDGRSRNWDDERRIDDLNAEGVAAEISFPNT